MVLVPIGISVGAWARSIDPKSKSRSVTSDKFTDDTGMHSFHVVKDQGSKKKTSKNELVHPKIMSPVQQVLEQTKEKEKRADGPDTENITFNLASTSSTTAAGKKGKKKSVTKSRRSDMKKSTIRTTIKRLKRKRNTQSNTKRQGSNKSRKTKSAK